MSSRDDALAARAARQVQEHAPTWMVFWSLRHRRFEAWECTDPKQQRAVHADSVGELWDLMQQVNLDLWRTRSPMVTIRSCDLTIREGSDP